MANRVLGVMEGVVVKACQKCKRNFLYYQRGPVECSRCRGEQG